MAYTVLARRYRSSTFDEVVGQNHVAQTLKKAIASGRIAHAFLFNGTRGVGKTSMARILAKALNCEKADKPTTEPCGKCPSCQAIARGEDIDVVEIDAASNTQVDKTREVILDNAQYRPARSRFKVYIIDEVHMLSKASFNALLKTLEEPPEHVKFILATTEPEKVLATIHSRCQRYDFRNIPTREIAEHLKNICKEEKIQADEEALMLVAKAGAGSMRDSLSLLDRLLSVGEERLTVDTIEQLLGLPKAQIVMDLVQAIGEGRVKDALTAADRMICDGLSPDSLIASLIDHLRNLLIIRTCGPDSTLVEAAVLSMDELAKQAQRFDATVLTEDITILEDLRRQLRSTQAGRALLDATLVRLALAEQFTSIADLLARVDGGGTVAQKKKPELSAGTASAVVGAPVYSEPRMSASGLVKTEDPHPSTLPKREGENDRSLTLAAQKETAAEAAPTVDDAEDDDLPRPGKVWEGPSLAELARQQAKPAAQSAAPASNVESVNSGNLPALWQSLLKAFADKPAMHGLLSSGQLATVDGEQAIIRYGSDDSFSANRLNNNGKRELVSDELSKILGRTVGVKFEVDPSQPVAAPTDTAAAANGAPRPIKPREVDRPAYTAPAPTPIIRPTPEQLSEFERDPLIRNLMADLGAVIVKISED